MKKIFENRHLKENKKKYTYGSIGIFLIILGWFAVPPLMSVSYNANNQTKNLNLVNGVVESADAISEEAWEPIYIGTPENVKSIYMTSCVAGTPSFRDDLVNIVQTTEVNSIIIDIKDFSGGISFDAGNPLLKPYISNRCGASDMKEFIYSLNKKGIYVIGRITVFQDPLYSVNHPEISVQKASDRSIWSDNKGIHYLDPGAEKYWQYILELSKESYKIGFDELNFDYIRFPSDGPMKDIYYPISEKVINTNPETGKAKVIKSFFEFLNKELREGLNIPISADLFGMTTTNKDDLNIGQLLEDALSYFDYVAPMVYPSHYPANFNGWDNPNDHVYDVVNFSMQSAYNRAVEYSEATSTPAFIRNRVSPKQLRTWIQDFDYGGNYDISEVRAEIQASYDAGVNSWMIWSPSNRYTIGALEKE